MCFFFAPVADFWTVYLLCRWSKMNWKSHVIFLRQLRFSTFSESCMATGFTYECRIVGNNIAVAGEMVLPFSIAYFSSQYTFIVDSKTINACVNIYPTLHHMLVTQHGVLLNWISSVEREISVILFSLFLFYSFVVCTLTLSTVELVSYTHFQFAGWGQELKVESWVSMT